MESSFNIVSYSRLYAEFILFFLDILIEAYL